MVDILKDKNVETAGSKWLKELKHILSLSFDKIRITQNFGKKLDENRNVLFVKKEQLKIKLKEHIPEEEKKICRRDIEKVDQELGDLEASKKF